MPATGRLNQYSSIGNPHDGCRLYNISADLILRDGIWRRPSTPQFSWRLEAGAWRVVVTLNNRRSDRRHIALRSRGLKQPTAARGCFKREAATPMRKIVFRRSFQKMP